MIEVLNLSLKKIRDALRRGEVSPKTLVLETMERCRHYQDLNAYVTLCEEHAMSMAEESYNRIVNKKARPLEGIPLGIKDLFCTKNISTTACSHMLQNFIPPYESAVTKRLWDSGSILIGKTNMDEFAMGSSNENSYYGPVKNPWNTSRVAGGSSGGSAAAVAAGLAYAALGSDTGGSVRQPAAFCGIVGLKPSYGRCSRHGMIAYASSFDHPGVLARNIEDACIVMDEIMGPCKRDMNMIQEKPPILADIAPNAKGKKVVYFKIIEEMIAGNKSMQKAWDMAIDALKENGSEIYTIESELFDRSTSDHNPMNSWLSVYYTLTVSEAYANLARYDGVRYGNNCKQEHDYDANRMHFGAEVQRRLLLGAYILSTKHDNEIFQRALLYRRSMQEEFNSLFRKFDAILLPTSSHEAFKIGHKFCDPSAMYSEDIYTILANTIQAPAISIPVCLGSDGLPMGIQIMTKFKNEVQMIEISKALERSFAFDKVRTKELNLA